MYKGHALPRLRGAMVSPDIDEEGLRVFGQEWNANLDPLATHPPREDRRSAGSCGLRRWLQSALKQLDAALPLCQKYGLRVVVDLHSPPGGRPLERRLRRIGPRAVHRRRLSAEVRRGLAAHGAKVQGRQGHLGLRPGQRAGRGRRRGRTGRLAGTGRAGGPGDRGIDPQRTIIVEPPEGGNPRGARASAARRAERRLQCSHVSAARLHAPRRLWVRRAYRYPGEIEGKRWDKAQLEAALKPAVEFQKKYNVHIYVGEFSAIRWAPDDSAYRYLKDLIDIFEAHGWDWSYHAFREWDGWSVEHGPDPKDHSRSKTPTDREQLLRSWFAKNRKR